MTHFLIVGAGAAGLMVARELACAGKTVSILEARERCGGRIYALPVREFGYPAEGGAEFIHGAAPVTRALVREARLSLLPSGGTRWSARSGALSRDDGPPAHADRFYQALAELQADLPIAEFLATRFGGPPYAELRRSITRMVEGYDAADPSQASTLALRDEWLGEGRGRQHRIVEGYGALIEFLASECRKHGASLHLGADVTAIDTGGGRTVARCRDGTVVEGDVVILTVPLPLWSEIALPPAAREKVAAGADIGFGNVVKILLRFAATWWAHQGGRDLADLSFLLSNATVPTWWTQHPAGYPVLTGWYAGPKADRVASLTETELVDMGLTSLAEIFELPLDRVRGQLVAAQAINWGNDPFARGAYSYATPKTREALAVLAKPDDGTVIFSGEALYAGADMGTVEAALASGRETARMILGRSS
ncbi:MAG TPA: NAD(P)/FAD-dependent oxidoreductase [Stellaceae bacterium]|nr:NAD(P)/FAD-dependent oxidoreductase [Stellaceae bacterium]